MVPAKRRKLDIDMTSNDGHLYPVLADELTASTPLTEVFVGTIKDRKQISRVIRELNAKSPIDALTHLKRVRNNKVLLYPAINERNIDADRVLTFLAARGMDVTLLDSHIATVSVAAVPPRVKRQHDVVNALWPCKFHGNVELERVIANRAFDASELRKHRACMRLAIAVARYARSKIGAVVVDPVADSVVAIGYDDTTNGNAIKHAVMLAIDNVARTQNGGAWNPSEPLDDDDSNTNLYDLRGLVPVDLFNRLKTIDDDCGFGDDEAVRLNFGVKRSKVEVNEGPDDGPYLCTGYELYVTVEPCTFCAMALVHSRIKRVFYGRKSRTRGALGSTCKIHTVPGFNHHYDVFGGLLEAECELLS